MSGNSWGAGSTLNIAKKDQKDLSYHFGDGCVVVFALPLFYCLSLTVQRVSHDTFLFHSSIFVLCFVKHSEGDFLQLGLRRHKQSH